VSFVSSPGSKHRCAITASGSWYETVNQHVRLRHEYDPYGTVRQCPEPTCGKTYVAIPSSNPGVIGVMWVRESWWAEMWRVAPEGMKLISGVYGACFFLAAVVIIAYLLL